MIAFATYMDVLSAMTQTPAEIGDNLRRMEIEQGFSIISEASWFNKDQWHEKTIISQDGRKVRLVALLARRSFEGAFSRLIGNLWKANLMPVIVEPNQTLQDWAIRHNFRERHIKGKYPHTIWHPRREIVG
jgi:hypothetical protein